MVNLTKLYVETLSFQGPTPTFNRSLSDVDYQKRARKAVIDDIHR